MRNRQQGCSGSQWEGRNAFYDIFRGCGGASQNGINKTVTVSCIMDGDDAEGIVVGNRIELKGVLTFKKKDDNLYFNLKVSEVNLSPVSESKDGIVGDMEFKGKVGKDIDMKKGKMVRLS